MNNKLEFNIINVDSLNHCLICSLLALGYSNFLFQSNELVVKKDNLTLEFNSPKFLLSYLSNRKQQGFINYLRKQLIKLVFVIDQPAQKLGVTDFDSNMVRQYLRKFSFFYSYYYLKKYPNDLSLLSIKKINMLAIRSLFILYNL